jgi:hypothetical protein
MYKRPLLPNGIRPPERFAGAGFIARPLRLADAEDDFAAVMDSAARLRGAMDPDDPWPEGLTLPENMVDLGWHEREHTAGHSFAWTLRDPDDRLTLGCAYLYPSDRAGFDAMAFWWLRTGHEALDAPLGAAFRALLAKLPLTTALPGRDIAWHDWMTLDARF